MSGQFCIKAKRIINLAYQMPVRVLVWGPGQTDEKGYAKRKEIKDEIRRRFPNSEVYFSEDKELRSITGSLPTLIAEIVHARAAHIVIVLGISRGAEIEIDHLSQDATIARKLWVLLPDKFYPLSGLAAEKLRGIELEFFSEAEFEDSTLASSKCVRRVLCRAIEQLSFGY